MRHSIRTKLSKVLLCLIIVVAIAVASIQPTGETSWTSASATHSLTVSSKPHPSLTPATLLKSSPSSKIVLSPLAPTVPAIGRVSNSLTTRSSAEVLPPPPSAQPNIMAAVAQLTAEDTAWITVQLAAEKALWVSAHRPPPPPAPVYTPAPTVVSSSPPTSSSSTVWQCIISHESGGNPTAQNPSSTASGLFQFLDSSWVAYGGGVYSSRAMYATVAQQWNIAIAAQARSGWSPWIGDGCTPLG